MFSNNLLSESFVFENSDADKGVVWILLGIVRCQDSDADCGLWILDDGQRLYRKQ